MVLYVSNQHRTLKVLNCIDFMHRKLWNSYKEKKLDVTDGELSGGVLSKAGILEHSTNRMNNKHTSRHLYTLRGPTKSVLSHPFI